MGQVNLFGKSIQREKPKVKPSTFKNGRKYLGFPCDVAQELPYENDERKNHIYNDDGSFKCKECKRLINEIEKEIFDK